MGHPVSGIYCLLTAEPITFESLTPGVPLQVQLGLAFVWTEDAGSERTGVGTGVGNVLE